MVETAPKLMACGFCGFEYDSECGKYGCPNCEGRRLGCSHVYDESQTCFECGRPETNYLVIDHAQRWINAYDMGEENPGTDEARDIIEWLLEIIDSRGEN